MEQFKNIILGFLIALVFCLGFKVYSLEKTVSNLNMNKIQESKHDDVFKSFVEVIKELKKLEEQDAK
jgi:predicted negative regulator of RcsB-dependent stress response